MKRLFFATIMLLAFIACDEDRVVGWEDYVIWDISPIEFRILVLDENGNIAKAGDITVALKANPEVKDTLTVAIA